MRTRWTECRNCPNGYENVGAVRHGVKLEFFSNKMGFIATLPQSLLTTVYLDRNPIPIGHADADSFFQRVMIGICSKAQMACTKGEALGQSPVFPTEANEPAKISSFHNGCVIETRK